MKIKSTVFLLIFGLFAVSFGYTQADLQPAALVNLIRSEPITVRQLRTEVERLERGTGRALTQEQRIQVLNRMIDERLVLQAAERDRITVFPNDVNQHIQQVRGQMAQQLGRQPTDAEFAEAIRNQTGLEMQAFTEQIRRQMILQRYLLHRKGDMINSAVSQPTEAQVRAEFNLRRAQFVRPETVEFDSIQVPFGPNAASRANGRQLIDRLARDIGNDPSRFDSFHERSRQPNSGYNAFTGTSVPLLPEAQAQFGQDFMDVAFSLRQGQVSRVIETNNEFLIIKVTRNLEFRNLDLDDPVPGFLLPALGIDPRNTITVRQLLTMSIVSERQQAVLAQATHELVEELRRGNPFTIFENNLRW